jgi:hypothetical protein
MDFYEIIKKLRSVRSDGLLGAVTTFGLVEWREFCDELISHHHLKNVSTRSSTEEMSKISVEKPHAYTLYKTSGRKIKHGIGRAESV